MCQYTGNTIQYNTVKGKIIYCRRRDKLQFFINNKLIIDTRTDSLHLRQTRVSSTKMPKYEVEEHWEPNIPKKIKLKTLERVWKWSHVLSGKMKRYTNIPEDWNKKEQRRILNIFHYNQRFKNSFWCWESKFPIKRNDSLWQFHSKFQFNIRVTLLKTEALTMEADAFVVNKLFISTIDFPT